MSVLVIEGGRRLSGEVRASGAKNSALPALVAACLARDEPVHLENIPVDADVATMIRLLRALGASVEATGAAGEVRVSGSAIRAVPAPYELVRRMRASFYVAGVLLALTGRAEVPLPGGCSLGSRPVDYHLRGLEQLGATIRIDRGCLVAEAPPGGLRGATIRLSRPSVGATIHLMVAASLARGETIIENAAREPEVVDVANLLGAMGGHVRGAGTGTVRIEGVGGLHGARYAIIPDRIEAVTWMLAAAITSGEVSVRGALSEHMELPILKLREAGYEVDVTPDRVALRSRQGRPLAIDVDTAPYPGFPTDLQQPFVALLSLAEGTSVVRETIFDRFRYVDELRRMGADIRVERDTAIIRGVPALAGARVEATDLRAGAALMLAGLAASGETRIDHAEMVDRGYEDVEAKLSRLGARVFREAGDGDAAAADSESWRRVFAPCAPLASGGR